MASTFSSPGAKPNAPETPAVATSEPRPHPTAGPAIDLILVGGGLLVVSVIIVLFIFFGLYWDIIIQGSQYPLGPSR